MKGIFKIEQHLPDTKQIVVKFCKAISHKSIDDYAAKTVNYSNIDMTDAESFVDDLMRKYGLVRIDKQELEQSVLDSNKSESISGSLNLDNLVGKVIEGDVDLQNRAKLVVRKVEL